MKSIRTLSMFSALLVLSAGNLAAEEEFPKPGPQQELLAQFAGDWSGDCKFFIPGGEAPLESKGTYSAKMELGGYFLIAKIEGDVGGQPFHGRSITGFDSFQKKYTGVWADSMSPALYNMAGEWDKAGKVYTETMTGPGPDGKPMKARIVATIKDEDHFDFAMYAPDKEGKEALLMEISYTRKK